MAPSGALMSNYGGREIAFERGDGAWLYDGSGNKYLDSVAGVAVCGLGHAHPKITKVISEQAAKLIHTSNLYNVTAQEKLAETLCQVSGMENAFFANSGAEANEAALKLARLYGHTKNIEVPTIIVMENSFHGRTMATLSATGNRKVQAGFEPLVSGFVRAPFNDIGALQNIAKNNSKIVAIMVEPIQGEGGVIIPADDYLKEIRKLCDERGWLMILDEIQTGNGRTGKYFAYQHYDLLPDIVTTAKGLGNGLPISACLARGIAATLFKPGSHGSTYGGNPLCCATAKVVVDTIVEENLAQRASELGERIGGGLKKSLAALDGIKEIRYKGLMIGIELNDNCTELVNKALHHGLLINVTASNVIRLLPALILTNEQADKIVDILSQVIKSFLSRS